MKLASSAASFLATWGPMWSKSNPRAGSPAGMSDHSSPTSDVILEPSPPVFRESLRLDYEALREKNAWLIMCALTPFGQTGPWRDYLSSDLLHMAAGAEMASSGYDEADVPNAPPTAPGGGNAWHMGCHFAYMA